MKTVEENFSEFYEKWMGELEDHLRLLVLSKQQSPEEVDYESLYNKLTAHHKEYYTIKWASAHEDVLSFYLPVWLTPLENAYLWVTGWKPSTAFRLVESMKRKASGSEDPAPANLSEEQVKKIEVLRMRIKADEERVEREMERQHVAMADRKMVELIRLETEAKNKGDAAGISEVNKMVEAAVKGLALGLEKVMKMADCARLKTLKGVLDLLTPIQRVDFLVATSMLLIEMRKWGKKRDGCVYDDDHN